MRTENPLKDDGVYRQQGWIHGQYQSRTGWEEAEMRIFTLSNSITTDRPTNQPTNRQTDGRTDGRTHPLIEMRGRI